MNDNADRERMGTVEFDGDWATITFRRLLRHTPEHVWDALTQPSELKEWLMCSSARIDGRTGGTIDMVSGPAQFHVTGKILTWDPPRVYEHEWKVAPVPQLKPHGADAVFRYELTPHPEGTMLVVTYRRLPRATASGFAPGGHVLLDRLEAQLNGEPLPSWQARFDALVKTYPEWTNP